MSIDKDDLIKQCYNLENELKEYKLWADMIPRKMFGANVRRFVSEDDWDIIRHKVYEKANRTCEICNKTNTTLHAHEDWGYKYKEGLMVLNNILALCVLCHAHKHLGLAGINIDRGELDEAVFLAHWIDVNSKRIDLFKEYKQTAFRLWDLKNMFYWKLVTCDNTPIDNYITIDAILNCVKNRK